MMIYSFEHSIKCSNVDVDMIIWTYDYISISTQLKLVPWALAPYGLSSAPSFLPAGGRAGFGRAKSCGGRVCKALELHNSPRGPAQGRAVGSVARHPRCPGPLSWPEGRRARGSRPGHSHAPQSPCTVNMCSVPDECTGYKQNIVFIWFSFSSGWSGCVT